MNNFLTTFFLIASMSFSTFTQNTKDNSFIYGITLENVNTNLPLSVESLSKLSKKPTARIVFDHDETPEHYLTAAKDIKKVAYVMGEILDSYDFNKLSQDEFEQRVYDYYKTLGEYVDIWEIGNEVNGEWNGDADEVVDKIKFSQNYIKYKGGRTAVTLYYNHECFDEPEYEMFRWVNKNLSKKIRRNLDYVFVSYYEDGCNGYQPDWQKVFDSLHVLFPNSKLGIGECGTKKKSRKEDYMKRYYSLKVSTPGFVGGYFWWWFRQDCVPFTKPLWNVLNETIQE